MRIYFTQYIAKCDQNFLIKLKINRAPIILLNKDFHTERMGIFSEKMHARYITS